jgi:glycerol-3-phosphate dehydrogenase
MRVRVFMRRDVARLTREDYDVVVVGGGIYGACATWEAALSGLSVALIEAGDFGQATSSNSLRTLHGGLRHLQRLDFARMRESIRARREWLRLAPHLARPLRFVLPTCGHGLKGPEALRAALAINDLVSFDRNRGVDAGSALPGSSVWSSKLARAILVGLRIPACNGAATWFDAVCLNTERLLWAVVSDAIGNGACAANYVRATGLNWTEGMLTGVRARDELTGAEFEIRTRCVINAAGPWVGDWASLVTRERRPLYCASKAFNLLTRPLPFKEGMGLPVRQQSTGRLHTYFVLPWNGRALVGTRHVRCDPGARTALVTRQEVVEFLDDLNHVLGRNRISGADVLGVYAGLLPEKPGTAAGDVELQRAPRVIDHGSDGAPGVFSVVGVKWTNSWPVAERAVRSACRFLGRGVRLRATRPRFGCAHPGASAGGRWRMDADSMTHLLQMYGPARGALFRLLDQDETLAARVVPDLPVIRGQIVHAVRAEMAVQLADVVMRRTPLYLSENLDGPALSRCAALMARELRWSNGETAAQIERVESLLQVFRGPLQTPQPIAASHGPNLQPRVSSS